MTYDECQEMVEVAHATYGGVMSPATVEVWANTFASDDAERMAEALALWLESEERFPTPAGLRQKARESARREIMEAPQRAIAPGQYPTFAEGIQIAYDSYCLEVHRQGREPKPFDQFRHSLSGVNPKARKQKAYR